MTWVKKNKKTTWVKDYLKSTWVKTSIRTVQMNDNWNKINYSLNQRQWVKNNENEVQLKKISLHKIEDKHNKLVEQQLNRRQLKQKTRTNNYSNRRLLQIAAWIKDTYNIGPLEQKMAQIKDNLYNVCKVLCASRSCDKKKHL